MGLTVTAETYASQRLEALAHIRDQTQKCVPAVLFLCVHNAGRSQMALGWFNHLAAGRAIAWSGGSEPGSELNQDVVRAMAEVGIDISEELPKPWTDEFLGAADVVVTMGCGDACPLVPGKRYEDAFTRRRVVKTYSLFTRRPSEQVTALRGHDTRPLEPSPRDRSCQPRRSCSG